ncbi:DegT/DnrJ/EryC1/StrS family aminotransferase [Actinoplanes awajinensis]|uniref:DegT/DnrJ/EryC1/StrS aminotransferase n=1 Tax=Actinoplanes awajinensis subsp. mycoplanecinus TaxID=135947 RepID=A0A0X3VCU7_9ACTN|nr:DegT/DnrJ/EryC1/StrS family aminotransferase [Actinoplanes awajinensis]KUL42102.1 hypothetical protein ADL15_02055 [Actinoplanes awajinensis subsp. mycoplanecinus]
MSTVLHYYRGRVALHATLRALHVSPGDEVIVPGYTCPAVVEPLLRLGIRPVFADIDRATLVASPASIRERITGRTRAVIVQHTFGYPAPVREITELPVIEDCAHIGPGSIDVGYGGVAAIYSYEQGKPAVAGPGGAAVVHDPALAAEMHTRYARYSAPPLRPELTASAEYLAYRLTDELGLRWRCRPQPSDAEYGWRMSRGVRERLSRRITAARRDIGVRRKVLTAYERGLDRLAVSHHPRPGPEAIPLCLPVRVFGKATVLREAADAGVELGDRFRTPPGYLAGSCPNAEWALGHLVTLPVRSSVSPADVHKTMQLFDRLKAKGHV